MLKSLISGITLLVLIYALNTKFGSIPPLGKFFDPDAGLWANAETSIPESEELQIDGLIDEVSVIYDERRVPHVFAQNEHDLYMAQGFITAKDRLFQMELQTYDAAGRLSERLGARTLERDRTTRREGLPYGAEITSEYIKENDPETYAIMQAYSKGVNAYIATLSPEDYPIEYKILDIAPEEWQPIKTSYLLKNMTRMLTDDGQETRMSNSRAYFGAEFIEKYVEERPDLVDPIIPASKVWDFDGVEVQAPDTLFVSTHSAGLETYQKPEGIGSNNWAVSGSKTASGFPILTNDPHLGLTLPSIWYEIQLHAPGLNTYGVSLQGTPGIIIGYNEHAAWGTTNTGADVMDWYEITFKDDSKREYWYDNEWKPTTFRIEEIKVRDQETVIDTVVYTHHGPVTEVYSRDETLEPVYYALRWIAYEPSNDLRTFLSFNRMETYDDFKEAVTHYVAPAQNFNFASNEGDIAQWISGKFPIKWERQGTFISDGSDPMYDWHGWIPDDHEPNVLNPERGFVSSANQESTAPDYPYVWQGGFAPFERGKRINDLLTEMEDITVDDMQEMLMDSYSYNAATILPNMLEWIIRDSLSQLESEILLELENWDYFNNSELKAPGIFRYFYSNFYSGILSDDYQTSSSLLRWLDRDHINEIIKENPEIAFVDNIETEEIETIEAIVTAAFKETVVELNESYGNYGDNWNWGILINNDFDHIGFIPGFGAQNVYSSGSNESVNATRGGWGPSWRMVVELGPQVKGYGVYPGGASGNPGSPNYDHMMESWRTGELYELNFYLEKPDESLFELTIKPTN